MPCGAPDCVYKDSKYYFYFQRSQSPPETAEGSNEKKRPEFQGGVAVADKPGRPA